MHFPRKVQNAILKRFARGERTVVVTRGDGAGSRVFSLDTYLKKRDTANRVKPWKHRKQTTKADPLGAVAGRVVGALRREEMYE